MAINIYLYSQQLSMTAPPPEYCVIIYGVAVKLHARCKTNYIICQLLNETSLFAVGIASIMANVAADTVVLSTTLYATYNIKQFANHATIKVSVTTLLLRDGTIYFSILLALNIANVIINLLNSVITISLFVSVFTSILISHLFLNLRQVHLAQGDTPSQPSRISDLQFASRIVGNIGAPLNHGLISDQIDEIIGSEDIEEIPQVVKEPLKDGLGLHDTNINLGLQESTV
ncbi:hypothetical protein AcW1_003270 [Taiwanofungus camphoratus]|nr:hypothetical protein AcW1_003270 [Antrodia cinnamomea]